MLDEIYKRQSIRKFKQQKVEDEKVEALLRAAMNAPTARNTQSWRFLIIRNREALQCMVELQPYTGMMKEADFAILVLGDTTAIKPIEYLYYDAAAAIENILIEAVHQGLGTCWCAIAPSKERINNFRNYYHIDEQLLPMSIVAVGYGNEEKQKVDRYDPLKISYFE